MRISLFTVFSLYAVPLLFLTVLAAALIKNVNAYDVFIEGASDGINTVVRILPSLVGMLTAVGVFRASGALDFVVHLLTPLASALGIPAEAMPLALLRPVSGSASIALLSDIIKTYGPDSYVGRVVSTMMGSTETVFYVVTVYLGSVGVKNTRYALAAALVADGISIIASAWICAVVFGR